ncbi:unnamed protein product [Lactuca virosa]|uniref:Uncharacterized protein n=1 Tax=Lactuca virosa TaxID=75947 RepID=A0AAU9MKP3_9ASTR|nr:unnamed protein product [Lactuca virosa]
MNTGATGGEVAAEAGTNIMEGTVKVGVGLQTKEVIFDHFHATAFQYTPLGILGPLEIIQKITKKDMKNYISTHYVVHRIVTSAFDGTRLSKWEEPNGAKRVLLLIYFSHPRLQSEAKNTVS